MSKKIKMFGATPSPYTQKMVSIFRYKHISYEAFMGDIAGRLKKMNIDPPKPLLLPTILMENEEGDLIPTTDSTPIIRSLEKKYPDRKLTPQIANTPMRKVIAVIGIFFRNPPYLKISCS